MHLAYAPVAVLCQPHCSLLPTFSTIAWVIHQSFPFTLMTRPLHSLQVSEEADGARILLSLEGKDMEQLGVAAGHLRRMLPSGCVVAEEQDPVGLNHKLRQSPSLKHRAAAEADADGHFSPRK